MKSDDLNGLAHLTDVFFNGRKAQMKKPVPATTDKPNMKMFMFQILNCYADLVRRDCPMEWEKTFKSRADGKAYKITVTLEEAE